MEVEHPALAMERAVRDGALTRALTDCAPALRQAQLERRDADVARYEAVMSYVFQMQGDTRKALTHAYDAISLYQRTGAWRDHHAVLLSRVAIELVRIDHYEDAMRVLQEACELVDINAAPADGVAPVVAAWAWGNIALCWEQMGHYDVAAEGFAIGLHFADLGGDAFNVAHLMTNRLAATCERIAHDLESDGVTQRALTELDQVTNELPELEEECAAAGATHLMDDVYLSMARALQAAGKGPEALELLLRGHARLTEERGMRDVVGVRLALTGVYRELGDLINARHFLDLARKDPGWRPFRTRWWAENALLAEAEQDWQEAFESFRRYSAASLATARARSGIRTQTASVRLGHSQARAHADTMRAQADLLQHNLQAAISERRRLEAAAHTDPLTGLGNRAGFTTLTEGHVGPYCVVMIDLDHFKRVNDTWGHAAGDRALVRTAALLRAACRERDPVFRLGGEEFVIWLEHGVAGDGELLAERVRELLHRHDWADVRPGLALTASFGVADGSGDEPVSRVLAAADRALYAAKRAGRDRVVVAGQDAASGPGG